MPFVNRGYLTGYAVRTGTARSAADEVDREVSTDIDLHYHEHCRTNKGFPTDSSGVQRGKVPLGKTASLGEMQDNSL